jgi:ankyrin repeat protein
MDMFYTNLSIFSLALLCATCTSFMHAMNPMAKKPDDAMQSPIVHLLRSINNQEKNRDSLHCLIKWVAAKDSNAINAKSQIDHGNTPLHEAMWRGHSIETIKLLFSLGADITKTNKNHQTPLEYACIYSCPCGCIPYSTFFAKYECKNADIVAKNKQKKGLNPIHLIMQNNKINYIETLSALTSHLINAGYSINAQDQAGFTPAHYALIRYEEPTLYLMPLFQKYNADFTIKNLMEQAPFQFAAAYFNHFRKQKTENPKQQITNITKSIALLKLS